MCVLLYFLLLFLVEKKQVPLKSQASEISLDEMMTMVTNDSTASTTSSTVQLGEFTQQLNGTIAATLTNGDTNGQNTTIATNHSHTSNSSNGFATVKKATEWVRLNIGGQYFVTTKTTLCKNAHSFFFKLLQDDPSVGLVTDKV